MLGLLLIYSVGKQFYDLAKKHNRSGWLFAILGILTYYASQFILGILIGVIFVITDQPISPDMDVWFTIGGIVLGAGITYLFYQLLKRQWTKKPVVIERDDLLDNV